MEAGVLVAELGERDHHVQRGIAQLVHLGQPALQLLVAGEHVHPGDQQRPLLELTASLQQLSRQPPVSVLAQPGSLTDMVHARAVIDAAMPVIEQRTAGVRQELAQLQITQAAHGFCPPAFGDLFLITRDGDNRQNRHDGNDDHQFN